MMNSLVQFVDWYPGSGLPTFHFKPEDNEVEILRKLGECCSNSCVYGLGALTAYTGAYNNATEESMREKAKAMMADVTFEIAVNQCSACVVIRIMESERVVKSWLMLRAALN